MRWIIKLVASVSVLMYFLARCEWLDKYHLVIGGIALAIGGIPSAAIAFRLRRRKRAGTRTSRGRGEHPLRPVLIGLVWGGVACGWLSAAFAIVDQFPVLPAFYDHDRPQLEALIQQLEDHGHFGELADLIDARLQKPISEAWKNELAQKEYSCLVKAATQARGQGAQVLLDRAVGVTNRYGLDFALANEAIARLADSHTIAELQTQLESGKKGNQVELERQKQLADAENQRIKQLGRERITRPEPNRIRTARDLGRFTRREFRRARRTVLGGD